MQGSFVSENGLILSPYAPKWDPAPAVIPGDIPAEFPTPIKHNFLVADVDCKIYRGKLK